MSTTATWIAAAGRIALLAVPGAMAAVVAGFIAEHGQPVPFWDEWTASAELAVAAAEGRLTFSDLLAQYNDSRMFFSNLLTAVSAVSSGWNLEAELYLKIVLALILVCMYAQLLGVQGLRNRRSTAAVLSVLALSLVQARSWLWSILTHYLFLLCFLVAAVSVVERRRGWSRILLAALCCECAAFSYANGFLAWLVCTPLVWSRETAPARRAVWCLAMAAGLALYFGGLEIRPSLADLPAAGDIALAAAAFLGQAIVAGLVEGPLRLVVASLAGSAGLAWLAANAQALGRREGMRRAAPWLALAGFVVASGLLVAAARVVASGPGAALAQRYFPLTLHFWIAAVAVALLTLGRPWRRRDRLNVAVIAMVLASATVAGIRLAHSPPAVRPAHAACLLAVPESRDVSCLVELHSGFRTALEHPGVRRIALERIAELERNRLAVFRDAGGARPKRPPPASPESGFRDPSTRDRDRSDDRRIPASVPSGVS